MGLLSWIRDRRPVDLDERSPQLGLKYSDLLVLQQLVAAGGDPEAPRHVVYYLYFDTEATSHAAATEAAAAGFGTDVRPPIEGTAEWVLVCERHDYVLAIDAVRDNTDFFDALAARHQGDYDGWEASVA